MDVRIIRTLIILSALLAFCTSNSFAQNLEIFDAAQEPFTPESLIQNYFIGEGVELLDIKFNGVNEASGYFSNGTSDLGIDQGIVLGTGKVSRFSSPHTNESSTLTSDIEVSDQELENITGTSLLKDVASYEITFIPSADTIQFNYVFASEEYPEYVCSKFNDIFGFFISGPNPNGGQYTSQNIAIVPGTSNLPVSINNVNGGSAGSSSNQADCASNANLNYAEFYNDNLSQNLIFDGVLDPFIAAAKVIPCEVYTIKFSIADVNDFLKDSAVFLEGKSFSSNSVEVKAVTVNSNGTITEGCAEASILFEVPTISSQDETIQYQILGTAENGVDYETLSDNIVIPAGEASASIQIIPIEDELEEGIESVGVVIENGACASDTIWVGIEDNYLVAPEDQGPIYLCDDLPNEVDFTIPFEAPSPIVFRNQIEVQIAPTFTPVYSTIKVENIYPSTLNQTDFIQVCIDELSHPWIDDLSIYLYGPDNQFIELTSKNGGNGGNGTQQDFYLNTCFTFDANQLIDDPTSTPPYNGTYQPEGDWQDFFGRNSFKVNGNWSLMMIDDFQGSTGTLFSWSIHFGKSYDISYSWSPNDDISCTDCPNPSFNPAADHTYSLNIEDTNGCSLMYDVDVFANSSNILSPSVSCGEETMESITFTWESVPQSESYEISINGGAWENIGTELSYQVDGLTQNSEVTFEIISIGACENSEITTTSCQTGGCGLDLNLISLEEPNCEVENSGSITVEATGGTEPYIYTFGDIESATGIFENLIKGDHTIYAIDADECTTQLIINIIGKEDIIIEGIVDNIECDESTGGIDLSVTGGLGQLELQWSSNFTGDINSLQAGNYELLVTDESGCTAEQAFTINQVADFDAEFEVINPACANDDNGSITVNLDDPSLTVDIAWSNGMTGSQIENLGPGNYQVVITNAEGCALTDEIILSSSSDLEIEVITGDNNCFGDNQGFTSLNVIGGTEPYSVLWSNNMEGQEIDGLPSGSYIASVTDANGCQKIENVNILEPAVLQLDELIVERISCSQSTGTISISPTGGSGSYMARLNDGEFVDLMTFTNLSPGNYSIEIMDDFGCTLNSDTTIQLSQIEEINLMAETNFNIEIGESISLSAFVTNRDDLVEYHWIGEDSTMLSCTNCQNPIFSGMNTTSYSVIATDSHGCEAIHNVVVQVNNDADVYVPNAFSPNADGINDRLSVFAKSNLISSVGEFSVYDRWGNQVFSIDNMEVNNMNQGWDGSYKNKSLNQGVFVWNLQVTFIDGSSRSFSGDVSLLR